jgi:hypothetical protein
VKVEGTDERRSRTCFALAAELSSWAPIFLVYATIGLGVIGLPLRLFTSTAHLAIFLWLVACVGAPTYYLTGSNSHAITVSTLLVAAACAFGLHAGIISVVDALYNSAVANDDHRPRAVLAFMAGTLVISVAAGAMALSLVIIPGTLVLAKSGLMVSAAVTAVAGLVLGLLVAIVSGLIDGAPRISIETSSFCAWRGPEPVAWRARRTPIRRRQVRTIVDRVGDLLRHALIQLSDALRILSVASARTAVNMFVAAVRILVNALIKSVNFTLKLIILCVRGVSAGIVSAWWFCLNAIELTVAGLFHSVVTAGLPVAALFTGSGLTLAAAAETRHYLIAGSMIALLRLISFAVLGILALTTAWIMLASQPISVSLRSAGRSASVAGPYALLLVEVGGWLVGLPGTLGYGRIHVGWVTLVSTTFLAGAFVWSQFIHRPQDDRTLVQL